MPNVEAQPHYDLGLAYEEMGLHADAIAELDLASQAPQLECPAQTQIALIHRSLGALPAALEALHRALDASTITPTQELTAAYELADTYEAHGAPREALRYFRRAARLDPTYNDPRGSSTDRLRRLTPNDDPA